MSTATVPTSIRLTPAEKKRIAIAARKRGLSPAAYIKQAALERTSAGPDDDKLAQLAAIVEKVREAVEDELDYRLVASRWENHLKNKTRLHTGEEVWRELGLSD